MRQVPGPLSCQATGAFPASGLTFGLANLCALFPCDGRPPETGAQPDLMPERVAAFIVRSRWILATIWVVIGAVAVVRAPRTPELLNVRGGADRETEEIGRASCRERV